MAGNNNVDANTVNMFISASMGTYNADANARKQAEEFLKSVRYSDNCLNICRVMLENPMPQATAEQQASVQFTAARILCTACLDHWDRMDKSVRKQLRDFLFDVALKIGIADKNSNNNNYGTAVTNKLLQAHAILVKRGWLEETDANEKLAIFKKLENIFVQATSNQAIKAIFILAECVRVIVEEFHSKKSSSVGLTLEWHRKAKESFQGHGLKHALMFGCKLLQEYGSKFYDLQPSHNYVINGYGKILMTLVEMLSWEYIDTDDGQQSNNSNAANQYYLTKRNNAGNDENSNYYEKEDTPLIYPTMQFRDIFLSPNFASLIVSTHLKLSAGTAYSPTYSCQAILLLSSVKGKIFQNENEEVGYLSNLLIPILGSITLLDQQNTALPSSTEAEGILFKSRIFSRLLTNFHMSTLMHVPNVQQVLNHLSKFTMYVLRTAIRVTMRDVGEHGDVPDPQEPCMVAFNYLIGMWVSLISNDAFVTHVANKGGTTGSLQTPSENKNVADIYNFLKGCVAPIFQHAFRGRLELALFLVQSGVDDDDEFEDQSILDTQMQDLAVLARVDVENSLNMLRNALLNTATRLQQKVGGNNNNVATSPEILLEELWWTCHFISYVLTQDEEDFSGTASSYSISSELPMIPQEILNMSFKYFVASASNNSATAGNISNGGGSGVDPLMLLTKDLFAVIDFECSRISTTFNSNDNTTSNNSTLSPLLAEKLLWTARKWVRSYLMPDPTMYSRSHDSTGGISPTILAEYGATSAAAHNLSNFLVQKACMFLAFWGYEDGVCKEACKLLKDLTFRKETRGALLQQDAFNSLVMANSIAIEMGRKPYQVDAGTIIASITASTGNSNAGQTSYLFGKGLNLLPDSYAEELVFIICRACDGFEDSNARSNNLKQVVQPVLQRFETLTVKGGENGYFNKFFKGNYQSISLEILRLLGLFCGIARATSTKNHNEIFVFISNYFNIFIQLIEFYKSNSLIVKQILEFFSIITEAQMQMLNPTQSLQMCTSCAELFKMYSKNNIVQSWLKLTNTNKNELSEEEVEERSNHIIAFLNILTNLASKGILDFFDYSGANDDQQAEAATNTVADAVLFGMQMIIPFITPDLLEFKKLCDSYFDLVSHVIESYPEKIILLESNLFKMFMESMSHGLRHYDTTVVRNTLSAIEQFATFIAKSKGLVINSRAKQFQSQHNLALCTEVLQSFLRTLFEILIFENFTSELLDAYGSAVLSLLVSESQVYMNIANQVLQQETNDAKKQRLMSAFQLLIQDNNVQMNRLDRPNRIKFRKNIRKFVSEVRGMLKKN